jgi:signal transduction histidine kinase/CheY-like chemotaxis protein
MGTWQEMQAVEPGEITAVSFRPVWLTWAFLCVVLWLLLGYFPSQPALLIGAPGLLVSLLLSLVLHPRRPAQAAAALVVGAGVTAFLCALCSQSAWALLTLIPAIGAAAAFFSPLAGLYAALLAALVALASWRGSAAAWYLAAAFSALGLTLWAALVPQRSLLLLALRQGLLTARLTDELKRERGELNRTIKALDLSYQLLEKTNRELAAAQQEALAMRDLRNRFATNLSHELRTPLNVILGFANLIYQNPHAYGLEAWPPLLLRDLAQLQRHARYLSQLVDDVVDLARIDALMMPIKKEPSDIRRLVLDTVDTVATLAKAKGLPILVSCPDDIPPLEVDPLRIRQVLFNLLSNAIRFTERGEIRVEVRPEPDLVRVSVSDTGRGIPAEELLTIFDEFYQVGRPKTGPEVGKGLGLAIAKRFVQLHGGHIWAQSKLGQGSTFTFTLPRQPIASAKLAGPSSPPTRPPRELPTALVVGAEEAIIPYLSRRLEGYRFLACPDLSKASEAIHEHRPIAVIVDGSLSAQLAQARELLGTSWQEDMPLISCPLPSLKQLLGEGEFAATFVKPVDMERLLSAIDQLAPARGQPGLVLIVDDDRGFVQLLRRAFHASGRPYTVEAAYNGAEAIRKWRRHKPHCVLLDLLLPDMSGTEILARVKNEIESMPPVIAVTAATPGEDAMRSRGAELVYMKAQSFAPGELTALLQAMLDLTSRGRRPNTA